MDKTDPLDAFIIANFARCGRITSEPWPGAQFLALQRLTRHRLHLIECVTWGVTSAAVSALVAPLSTPRVPSG